MLCFYQELQYAIHTFQNSHSGSEQLPTSFHLIDSSEFSNWLMLNETLSLTWQISNGSTSVKNTLGLVGRQNDDLIPSLWLCSPCYIITWVLSMGLNHTRFHTWSSFGPQPHTCEVLWVYIARLWQYCKDKVCPLAEGHRQFYSEPPLCYFQLHKVSLRPHFAMMTHTQTDEEKTTPTSHCCSW